VSGGSLGLNGSLTSPSNVTVGTAGRLTGNGTIAATTAVLGHLAPGDRFGTMTFASNLTFGSASRLQWELGSNSFAGADLVAATTVTATNGARVDVLLNSPGSKVNFLHAFWRTNRTLSVLNATALTGTFTLGTNSTDAGGRPSATYGSFSLTNSATNVSLLWNALPGFAVIDDPTVTITLPATNSLTLPAGVFSLKIAASVNNRGGSSLSTLWTQVTGPVNGGTASFANTAATSTKVQFSDPGDYRLRITASNEVGSGSADLLVTVVENASWHQTLITFTNYPRTEPLTNFPALLVLGTNIAGFDYADFLTPDGSDLRVFSADGATELNYEIDDWNPAGLSRVWVQVPVFTNHTAILARWGDPAAVDAPAYTTDGSTWSNGFLGVWHLAETNGAHRDSALLSTSRVAQVTAQGTAAGVVGGADSFNGTSDYVSLSEMGTNARVTVECWVFLNATPGGGDIGLVSSDPWSAGITHFKTSSNLQLKAAINGAGTVNSANNLLSVSNWCYAAYTVAGGGATDFKTWFNAALVGSATGSTNNILTDVNLARENGGRYLNARLDEVRISSVARSSNWLWATYQNIASNAAFASYSAVFSPTNHPPALAANSHRTVAIGQWLLVTNAATDAEAPPQSLTFSLLNPPANATVNADTGVLAWRVPAALAGTTNPITVLVTDNGSPGLTATQQFNVMVPPLTNPPTGTALQLTNGQWQFTLTGPAGPDSTVQASTNLTNWTNVLVTNSPSLPFNWTDTNAGSLVKRFYRVLLGP
jgi:hypothetical protein